MPAKPNKSETSTTLRIRAEKQLGGRTRSHDETDALRMLHELQVHQIELEIQNADLSMARDEAETLLEKYTELYDFAPVGYFTIASDGAIRIANLTGAAMVGIERSRLTQRSFRMLLAEGQREAFTTFIEMVFADDAKQSADFEMANRKLDTRTINIEAQRSRDGRECSAIIRDITALKVAENTARRNIALNKEITRRKRIESDLQAHRKEQSRILRQARLQQKQLRDFSHRILHVQEEERKRISRELHDVIAQTLVSINMHLEVLSNGTDTIPKSLERKISKTQLLVEKSLKIVHDFARQLRPAMLDQLGLIPALQMYMKEFMGNSGIHISLETCSDIDHLPTAVRTTFYRIAQEALTNVARHSNATHVEVRIENLGKFIHMIIKDNGSGFQPGFISGSKKKNRLGLIGMKERSEMIGGKFTISSAPGGPTMIFVEIPLSNK
jgi:PAS domain S-box-containing protein